MSDKISPFRTRVLSRLTDLLKGITPDNGYYCDLSDFIPDGETDPTTRVFRGRVLFGDTDPLPMISIIENDDNDGSSINTPNVDSEAAAIGSYDWELVIQGFCREDPLNPTDAAQILLADIRKILIKERMKRHNICRNQGNILGYGVAESGGKGNCIEDLALSRGCVSAPTGTSLSFCVVRLNLKIIENIANPDI